MAQKIGYQDGIAGFVSYMRKIPGVRYRPTSERPAALEQWSWLEKLERTLNLLKHAHDSSIIDTPPPPPPPPPPPSGARLAPMTHYTVDRADARYCVRSPGVTQTGPDQFQDEGGFRYTENGLCAGGRTGKFVSVLKPADSMDGREPCDGYEKDGRVFPPWPPEPYEV